jgi:hypothetical protein
MALESPMDLTESKIAASEARGDTRLERVRGESSTQFEQLRGDIKALDAKVSGLPSRWDLGLGLLALFVALVSVLALGTALFGLGFSADDISTKAAAKAIAATSGGRR